MKNILVVGLGLIGGSLCKAIKEKTDYIVYGSTRSSETIRKALECGAIDKEGTPENFKECDIVIVCLHPTLTNNWIKQNISLFKKGAIICDANGIKGTAVDELTDLCIENGLKYVSTHPMAGKQFSGFDYSEAKIFYGANFIGINSSKTDSSALHEIILLAEKIGFGRIIITTPTEHDRIIAYTSQLAHIVANAYVKSPTIEKETGFSGGSFQDMTRIAPLNEDMWTDLFMQNRENLVFEIDTLIKHLSEYKEAISENSPEKLKSLLRDGRICKEKNLASHNISFD